MRLGWQIKRMCCSPRIEGLLNLYKRLGTMLLCEVMSPRPYQECFNSAMRLLARRDHSCLELSRKLKQRGFSKDHIQSALVECHRFNYLDDAKFARLYTLQLQRKGYGSRRIRQMLIAKGIAAPLISDTLEQNCTETQEHQDCRTVLVKKLKSIYREPLNGIPRERLFRFLTSRGFSPAIIRRTMDDVLP